MSFDKRPAKNFDQNVGHLPTDLHVAKQSIAHRWSMAIRNFSPRINSNRSWWCPLVTPSCRYHSIHNNSQQRTKKKEIQLVNISIWMRRWTFITFLHVFSWKFVKVVVHLSLPLCLVDRNRNIVYIHTADIYLSTGWVDRHWIIASLAPIYQFFFSVVSSVARLWQFLEMSPLDCNTIHNMNSFPSNTDSPQWIRVLWGESDVFSLAKRTDNSCHLRRRNRWCFCFS